MKHMHLPLPEPLHAALAQQARSGGTTATALAREAIEQYVARHARAQLEQNLNAYIHAEAGGAQDLDDALEHAGVEHLLATR